MLIALGWLLPLLVLAIYCPPNNQDSMTYHLVRVQHWIQNRNVNYYPTSFTVQKYYNVLSEYLLLHTQLLSGNDYFLNTIQYSAMLGALLTSSLIGRELGASAKGQWFCIVLVLTMPMGILQSTTTQNDYLAGFFILSTIYWGLRLLRTDVCIRQTTFWFALSIALGGFTKYSFFLIALPFTIWFGTSYLLRRGYRAAFLLVSSCVLLLLFVYLPFWYRNYQVLGSILSPAANSPLFLDHYSNETMGWRVVMSNLVKNLTMHIALPSRAYNAWLLDAVKAFHRWIGFFEDNPLTTMGTYAINFSINEDTSGNPIHLGLFGIAIGVVFTRTTTKKMWLYSLCLLGAWFVYSAGFKWQYFHSRTQLPLFQAMAPLTASTLNRWVTRRPYIGKTLMALLLVSSLPYVYGNPAKNLLSVRTIIKQVIGYAPLAVYRTEFPATLSEEELRLQLARVRYYPASENQTAYCRSAKVEGDDNKLIIKCLAEIGYTPGSEPSLWTVSRREHLYFPVNPLESARWDSVAMILERGKHQHMGIVMESGAVLLYPLWAKGRQLFGDSLQINYVNYPALLDHSRLNRLKSGYTCVITNLSQTAQWLSPRLVRAEHIIGPYRVIELKSPSLLTYHNL